MKRAGGYYVLMLFIAGGILGLCLQTASPVFAERGGGHGGGEGIVRSGELDLAQELDKTWDYLTRKHFHNYLVEEMPEDKNPALCFVCHGSFPHQNAKMTRSILNMHVIFISCEGCHFKYDPNEKEKFGFRWFDGGTSLQARQRHYGTKYDKVSGVVLMESEETLFKITPYLKHEGKYVMINMRQDDPWAQKMFVKRERQFTPEEQAKLKTTLHSSIETKGRECGECHSVNAIMNFKALGFDDERVKDLTGLNIVGMVEKYQKFYIPDIFKQKRLYEAPIIEERAEK